MNKKTEMQALSIISKEGKITKLKTDPIELLRKPAILLSELVTGGFAVSSDTPVIVGRIIQAGIKGKLIEQIGKELYVMREKGKIKEDYFASNDASASLDELLGFIDSEAPDKERFKAIKSIFVTEISLDTSETDRQIAHELFKTSLKLESMGILILKTCYQMTTEELAQQGSIRAHGDWVRFIAEKLKIKFEELINLQDDKLVELGLITGRTMNDKSGVILGQRFRLTGLGIALCDFITRYP